MSLTDRLELLITANGSAAVREFESVGKSASTNLSTAEGASSKLNLGLLAAAGGAATAGIAIGKFALDAANDFETYGLQVSKIQRVTGETAEQSSDLAFAFHSVGIDADTGATLIGRFSKNVDSASDPVQKFGFNVRDAQGQLLPMNDLLGKVADQFAAMPDGPEKTAQAITDFGRSGAQLIPLLDKGSAGLAELSKQAAQYGLVLNQSDIQASRDAIAAHRDFDASLQGISVTIGRDVLPMLTKAIGSVTQFIGLYHTASGADTSLINIGKAKEAGDTYDQLTTALSNNLAEQKKLASEGSSINPFNFSAQAASLAEQQVKKLNQSDQELLGTTAAVAAQTGSSKDAILSFLQASETQGTTFATTGAAMQAYENYTLGIKTASDDATQSTKDLDDAITNEQNDLKASLDPLFAVTNAQQSYQSAQQGVLSAMAQYGPKSAQAQQANILLAQAGEKVYGSLLAVKQGMNDGSITTEEMNTELANLQQLGLAGTASGAANVVTQLQGYIYEANNVPTDITTNVNANISEAQEQLMSLSWELASLGLSTGQVTAAFGPSTYGRSGGYGSTAHASGGNLSEGWNTVGEHGVERIFKAGPNATVTPSSGDNQYAGMGGGIPAGTPIIVQLDGQVLATAMYQPLRRLEASYK